MVDGAMTSDLELLRQYAQRGCAQSFAALVRRHVAWVHGASMRQVSGDAHLAEDVTQAVFILLARRASMLPDGTLLTGWLFNTVRYAAAEARRKAARRRKHEARAAIAAGQITPESEEQAWQRLAPLLDETVALLRETERQAVLLRYFDNKSFEEIAVAMGINEAAARKRVSRGVRRLREVFVNRGVIAPAVAVLTLLLTRAAGASPAPSFADAVTATAVRVGPTHALALSIVRRTTLRMLRARQRLAAAIIACAGVCFLGLWALLIASMLEPDAPELADLIDPLDTAGEPELLLLGQNRFPLDAPPVRGDAEERRPTRTPRKSSNPRPAADPSPTLDRFWRLRPDLDPRNGPTSAAARPGPRPAPQPVRHDRDYDDAADTYAGTGGGGGGGTAKGADGRRGRSTPGQVDVTVNRGNADPDRVRTASTSGADAPAPAAGRAVTTFRGNVEQLTRTVLTPGGNRPAPFEYLPGANHVPPFRSNGGGGGGNGSDATDFVRGAVDPYPSELPHFFGPTPSTLHDRGVFNGRGPTAVPVIARDGNAYTASSVGPLALVPASANPWRYYTIVVDPTHPAALALPGDLPAVPEPATGLLALGGLAAISLSRHSRRRRTR
jgi:RNA polymerase sigma factor (sigma-70 family)